MRLARVCPHLGLAAVLVPAAHGADDHFPHLLLPEGLGFGRMLLEGFGMMKW